MAEDIFYFDSSDNVGVLLKNSEGVPLGHKVAIQDIPKGKSIIKFGHVIGIATELIPKGAHVHTHNVSYVEEQDHQESLHSKKHVNDLISSFENQSEFQGYLRKNGDAGIRNYIVVAATVNCSATVVKRICEQVRRQGFLPSFIDGIVPVTHQAGCAQAIGGLNYDVLNRTLSGWIYHPNVVGALVVGLGCEGTTWGSIQDSAKTDHRLRSDMPIYQMGIQNEGGTSAAIERGVQLIQKMISEIPVCERTALPLSHLKLALNCGGSDAFSSITANPLLGLVSDVLVQKKSTVVLAEIPECHGAEDLLRVRAKNDLVKKKLDDTFHWWKNYSEKNGVSLNCNLSPGNIRGGITTILEKSLGAVAKAGHSPLVDVVQYSEPIREQGFVLMNTPGFDPVSVTGLVAGGCQMVTFTTGRGSVYGCSLAPTIKVATQSELFRKMNGDMDFDAGAVLNGVSLEVQVKNLLELVVNVASGQKTKSEALGFGDEEFVPWPIGETL